MNSNLEISREARILRLTLNRPDKRNALTSDLCREIADAIDQAQDDGTVGSILLDAKGDVFCAGMDLDEASAPDAPERTAVHERLFTFGARASKPIVAAVQGPALGGGIGIICNAHVAIAAHGASFGLTEIRIGMWPFVIYRSVANALGERRALELSMMGRIFNVPEAVQWGLIHEAVPAFELDDRATAIAMHLSQSSPEAVRLGLEFVRRTYGLDSVEAAPIALEMRNKVFASADFKEGVAAFREKRRPDYFKR
jgi:enoyl-CoA hydratase/carnithine racemase